MSFKLTAVAWNVGVDKSTDRLVLLALASKADDNGRNCFPSVDGICAMTLMNRKTVFAAIARLADRGLLSVRKRACTNSNEYVLHVDRWTENGSTENGTTQKRDNPKKVQQSSQKRDNGSTENGTTVVPKTVHDSINTLSTTQSCTQSIDAPASADLFDEPVQMVEKPKKKTADRGSRLTIDVLPDDWKAFAEAEEPDLDPYRLFDNFKDYWTSVSGAKAIKKDWTATWRNFVRGFNNAEAWKRRPMLKNGVNPNKKNTDPQYGIGVCQPIPEEEVHWLTDEERAESRRQMEAEGYAPF